MEHVETKKNLHVSTDYRASISTTKWEVSCFGDNGEGDEYDSWEVSCDGWKYDKEFVKGSDVFHLKNVKKDAYLYGHNNYVYNRQNCGYQCPIMGNLEISADDDTGHFTKWRVHSGILMLNDPEIDSIVTENPDYDKDD